MANFTVSRLGAINQGSDKFELFLKVFSGEVLTEFDVANIMMPLHQVRTIAHGKSAQFPVVGKADASYHTPGTELTGQNTNHGERVINIDNKLVSDVFIADIDEAMNHYDVRSIYTHNVGRALADKADKTILQVALLAARASATITGGNGGSVLTDAAAATTTNNLRNQIAAAAQKLDEKNVPSTERFGILRPAQWYLLSNEGQVVNRDFGNTNGTQASATFYEWAGVRLKKSNNIPNTNIASSDPLQRNSYHGNFTTTVAPVFHRSAFGTVKLMDLAVEAERSVRHQGHLIVASYAMGHGILRPEAAVEIRTAAP
jgi:hypothetical protein